VWGAGYRKVGHWNGSSWTVYNGLSLDYFNSVFERSASDVWVVGAHDAAHFDGSAWTTWSLSTLDSTLSVGRVWSDAPGHAVAIGALENVIGVVAESDGTSWTLGDLRVDHGLIDVALVGSDLWALGPYSTLIIKRP
jgi:hypothetical protein